MLGLCFCVNNRDKPITSLHRKQNLTLGIFWVNMTKSVVIFIEEILIRKPHFLCSIWFYIFLVRQIKSAIWVRRSIPHPMCSYKKKWSENRLQIYRTLIPKCNFNKVAEQIYWNHTLAWGFSCKFAACFQSTCFVKYPACIFLLKVRIETLEPCLKSVQS